MEPQLNEYFTSKCHMVIITNSTKDKFLSISFTSLRWTDNFNLASCFDNWEDAVDFTEQPAVRTFIGDISEEYIWTDTGKSVFED